MQPFTRSKVSIYLFIYLFIYLSIYLSIYLFIYLSSYLSIFSFVHLFIYLFIHFLFSLFIYCLGHGRMKRNHVQVDLHHCSRAAGLEMQRCYELMGFTYEQKCEYKTAHCYYIVRCRHNSNRKDRKYTCEELVHRVNYTSLCCEAIC